MNIKTSATILLTLLLNSTLHAQHLTLLSIDSSKFPQMTARVFIESRSSAESDGFIGQVRDNGSAHTIRPTSHRAITRRAQQTPASILVCLDASFSNTELSDNRKLLEVAVNDLSRLAGGSTKLAMTMFDNHAHIASDFTLDADQFKNSFHKYFQGRATSYTEALFQEKTGAFSMFDPSSKSNAIILISDGYDTVDVERVRETARRMNCAIYCIAIGKFNAMSLRSLAEACEGNCFTGVASVEQMRDVTATIQGLLRGRNCFDISWTSDDVYTTRHDVTFDVPAENRSLSFSYTAPESKLALLEHPSHLSFGRVQSDKPATASIALHAVNFPMTIDSIQFTGMPFYKTTATFPLVVPAFTTTNIPIVYVPLDSGFTWTKLTMFTSQNIERVVTMSGGYPGHPPSISTLRILRPTNGERLPVDSYIPVEWEGCAPEDYSRVELSTDGGSTWNVAQENVRGTLFMLRTPKEAHERCCVRVTQKIAMNDQGLGLQREKMRGTFALLNANTFCADVRMNPTLVGSRKDKVIEKFITNSTDKTINVEGVEINGDNASEFKLCSQGPPFALPPNESRAMEFSFMPNAAGMRSARLNIKTTVGYATPHINGFGIDETVLVNPQLLDFGRVQTGDSVVLTASSTVLNTDKNSVLKSRVFLIGPDTTQFGIVNVSEQQSVKGGEKRPITLSFKPNMEGRTSAQLVLLSDADDSPHIIQLYGTGTSDVKDPALFREIAAPTALTPAAGTLALGTIDLLGLVGAYGLTDNVMIHAGALIPVPIDNRTSTVYSIGIKAGYSPFQKVSVAAGYQYVRSTFDNKATSALESNIRVHAPYGVITVGDDEAKASLAFGYAFKHHVTITDPGGFDADAMLVALSGDYRMGARWKLCAEAYSFRSLGYIPLVATARFLSKHYSLDFGLSYIGLTTGTQSAPSIPVVPVIGLMWVW